MDLQEIIKKLPEAMSAALCEKNRERYEELKEQIGESAQEFEDFVTEFYGDVSDCVEIVFDMLKEPLAVYGIELEKSRDLGELKELVDEFME